MAELKEAEARRRLIEAGLCFEDSPEEEGCSIDCGDTWMWGCADGEDVPPEEACEVWRLFTSYGWCGVLYWISKRRDNCRSEFYDINRFIEFVTHEEEIVKNIPGSSKRAYHKAEYLIRGDRTAGKEEQND